MPRLDVRIEVNGNPLRRAYVEHLIFGVSAGMYITDDNGRVRDENGDRGIDSPTLNADIRIHCQNSVVRILDGEKLNIGVHQDRSIRDGSTVNLNRNSEQDDHFAILNRCYLAYDIVFKQFRPFSQIDPDNRDFPLGRLSSLRKTKDRKKRIELSYPSHFPFASLAFVEPKSASTGYPLMHILPRNSDGRLFGERDQQGQQIPTLIPGELAHALHLSLFSLSHRSSIQSDFLAWITTDFTSGGGGTHQIGKITTPMVAYIEAFDHFAGRFAEYIRQIIQGGRSTLLRQQEITATIRRDFITQELSGSLAGFDAVASLDNGNIVPAQDINLSSDDEGAVYGCIFIDFARRVGLRTAVNAYLRSAISGKKTFGQYKSWISANQPQHFAELEAAQNTWGV